MNKINVMVLIIAVFALIMGLFLFSCCDDDDGDSQGSDDDSMEDDDSVDNDDATDDDDDYDYDDDDDDDDDNTDDDDDDDFILTEPTPFIITYPSSSYLFVNDQWVEFPVSAPALKYFNTLLEPLFVKQGNKFWGAWNCMGMYFTAGFQIVSFDLANGWQSYSVIQDYNATGLFAVDEDKYYFRYSDYYITNNGFEYFDGTSNNFKTYTEVTSMFYLQEGQGMYADAALWKETGGVTVQCTLPPGYESPFIESLWLFDIDNGWCILGDNDWVNPPRIARLDQGDWSIVLPPADANVVYLRYIEFAGPDFGIVTQTTNSTEYWIYDTGVWTVENLQVPDGIWEIINPHVVRPGWYYLSANDFNTGDCKLFEIKDGVTTEIELPAGKEVIGIFTLGPGSPEYAPGSRYR